MSKTTQQLKFHTPLLDAKGLRLCPLAEMTQSQLLELLRLRNEPNIRHAMYTVREIDTDAHLAWCNTVSQSTQDHIYGLIRDDGVRGRLGFRAISWGDLRCDWAFFLSSDLQGQGVGGALERTALAHVFETLQFNKLNCEVIAFNDRVIEMHTSFGFSIEGVRRDHIRREDEFHDVVFLGMTREDYAKYHKTAGSR